MSAPRDSHAARDLPAYTATLRAAVAAPGGDLVRVNRHDLAATLGDFARVSRLLRLLVNKRHGVAVPAARSVPL